MLRAGAILLTLWTAFNLALALGVLFMLLVLGRNSPALLILYGSIQGQGLDPRALATINALAVVCNAAIAATCTLSLAVIWIALVRRTVWAFWSTAGCLLFLQVARWASDSLFYHQGLLPNLASSL